MKNHFFRRVKKDARFRIKLLLCVSTALGAMYSAFLFFIGSENSSKWFLITSVYYALLSVSRVFAFAQIKSTRNARSKMKILRACGCFLLLINLAVSVMSFVLINEEGYIKHHEITVIALATYTFSSLTLSVIGGVKYFKRDRYAYSCAKLIGLVSSGVSLLTLTNTMLATFGERDMALRSIILPILSAAVSSFIILSAIFAIRKANTELRILKNEKE